MRQILRKLRGRLPLAAFSPREEKRSINNWTRVMALTFFDRLYTGFRAEYFVMGELFRFGYEGFKLPADFGFDILATNQKELSLESSTPSRRKLQPPYALQVKSRQVGRKSFSNNTQERPEAFVNFRISLSDFELISAEPNGYLVCVIFLSGAEGELTGRTLMFWLHSGHLRTLKERAYLPPSKPRDDDKQPYLDLKVCVRLLPQSKTRKVIERLCKEGTISNKAKLALLESLPETSAVAWRGSEYLSLVRSSKTAPGEIVVRQIPPEMTDLSNLGREVHITSLN